MTIDQRVEDVYPEFTDSEFFSLIHVGERRDVREMLSARQRILSSTLGRAHGAPSTTVRRLVVNLALLAQAQYESPPAPEAGVSPDPACLADSECPRGLDPSGETAAAPLPSPLSAPLRRRTPEEVAAFREVTSRLLQQQLIELDTEAGPDWLRGEIDGKVGLIPRSYVQTPDGEPI